MNDDPLQGWRGHFSHLIEKALITGARRTIFGTRRTVAGGIELRQEDGGPCLQEPARPSPHTGGEDGEAGYLEPYSSVGNFPLLEKPPGHHTSAFLKCLTAQGFLSSGLASPPCSQSALQTKIKGLW